MSKEWKKNRVKILEGALRAKGVSDRLKVLETMVRYRTGTIYGG